MFFKEWNLFFGLNRTLSTTKLVLNRTKENLEPYERSDTNIAYFLMIQQFMAAKILLFNIFI